MNKTNNDILEYELVQLIKLALEYYDDQNITYNEYINTESVKFDFDNDLIILNDKEYSFELLGYFDNQNNIWIWAWVLPDLSYNKTILARELLNYGLKLEPSTNSSEHFIIRSLFVNSRILLEEFVQLDTYLGIVSFILKDKIFFIYSRKRYINKHDYVTVYYLIK